MVLLRFHELLDDSYLDKVCVLSMRLKKSIDLLLGQDFPKCRELQLGSIKSCWNFGLMPFPKRAAGY
jgi:hypothetical protein